MEAQNFWDDQEKARETIDEVNQNKEWVDGWEELSTKLIDLEELKELIDVEEDEETLLEVDGELNSLQGELENLELKHMLGEREDKSNAILTNHPGAGGTEAHDRAQMLKRKYSRSSDRH
ncbi:PCRF domain-containing protein, partial [bacterium]|nr:PCRF domain-containing protein [bacterium]